MSRTVLTPNKAFPVRAGDMRFRAKIFAFTNSGNEFNETVQAWSLFAEVWCDVVDMIGEELYAAKEIQSMVTTKISIRYRAGVQAGMRVRTDRRFYTIDAALDPDGLKVGLLLLCRGIDE